MKALILNSGMGSRMKEFTFNHPKCMTSLDNGETILSRQLKQLSEHNITDIVITTGPFADKLVEYCISLNLPIKFTFVNNESFSDTNYIYSIYLAKQYLNDSIILIHGDLLFEDAVLDALLCNDGNGMIVSTTEVLPQKDFKAVLKNNVITKIDIESFDYAVAAQPMYKLKQDLWLKWLNNIEKYCNSGITTCYAENALNEILPNITDAENQLNPIDIKDIFCHEIDTLDDYNTFRGKVSCLMNKHVYMCVSTDILHAGHINIINKASSMGHLTIGVLSDKAVASYKRFPLLSCKERKAIFRNVKGVDEVVDQDNLSYIENIRRYKPDIIVHGDDWKKGIQSEVRAEVIKELSSYGGELIELPYTESEEYRLLEKNAIEQLAIPDKRRSRLKQLLNLKTTISVIEAHNGITGLIAEKTIVYKNNQARSFDAMWVSSLCDSTAKGKPDIELVDMSSRLRTLDEILDVTTKPIILDGDTGGLTEHFVYTVRTLERMGISAIIIEDKVGLKKNSLFGTEVQQMQDSIENFSAKIKAGKNALRTKDFLIIARIESLILENGIDDALKRAFAYVAAGADGIMIHSRQKQPDEIFSFCERFRSEDSYTPIVVVPTAFSGVTEDEFAARNINVVIYANQLTRSGFPAMQKVAKLILENKRAKEADKLCMSIKDIITLIPE